MSALRRRVLPLVIAAALLHLATWSCDDYEPECTDACYRLAECEDEWLHGEGEEPMSETEFDRYVDDCVDDCESAGSDGADSGIECILDATCEELLDGECR
jgi:hypothetical protein